MQNNSYNQLGYYQHEFGIKKYELNFQHSWVITLDVYSDHFISLNYKFQSFCDFSCQQVADADIASF